MEKANLEDGKSGNLFEESGMQQENVDSNINETSNTESVENREDAEEMRSLSEQTLNWSINSAVSNTSVIQSHSVRSLNDEDLNQSTSLGRISRSSTSLMSEKIVPPPKEPYRIGRFYVTPVTLEKRTMRSASVPRQMRESSSTPQRQQKFLGIHYKLNDKEISSFKEKRPMKQGSTKSEAYMLGKRYRLGGIEEEDDPLNDIEMQEESSSDASKSKAKRQKKH